MVQTVKRCLKKAIGRTTLSYDGLNTLLIEVESIINSRPITYVNDDQEGITYALSPSHLINGRRIANSPNSEYFDVISTHQSLTRKARHHRHLLNKFTKCWRRDYLVNLRESHAATARVKNGEKMAVGDVVVLKDESIKRSFWKLATDKRRGWSGESCNDESRMWRGKTENSEDKCETFVSHRSQG